MSATRKRVGGFFSGGRRIRACRRASNSAKGERLHEVVVGAGLQSLHAVADSAERRQENNRRLQPRSAHGADEAKALHNREHTVNHHDIIITAARQKEPLLPICSVVGLVAMLAKPAQDVGCCLHVILD